MYVYKVFHMCTKDPAGLLRVFLLLIQHQPAEKRSPNHAIHLLFSFYQIELLLNGSSNHYKQCDMTAAQLTEAGSAGPLDRGLQVRAVF